MTDIGRASVDDIGNVDGGIFFLDLQKAKARGKLHTISGIEYSDKGHLKVKMHSSLDALEKLAKIHGLYAPETNVTVQIANITSPEERDAKASELIEKVKLRMVAGGG